MIQTARALIQSEPTIVLRTWGHNQFEPTERGHHASGWWVLNRERVEKCRQVVVYRRPEGAAMATVLVGSCEGIEKAEDVGFAEDFPGKVRVVFTLLRTETTVADWDAFSDSRPGVRNFRRYLNC